MSNNKLDARQSRLTAAQAMIGSAASDTLDTIFPKINNELAKLFEDRNIMLTDGGNISFTGTSVTFSEVLNLTLNQKISGAVPQVISLTSTTRTLSSSGDMIVAVIDRSAGTATVSVVVSGGALPAVTSANQEVFLIAKRVDALDGTQRLYFRNGFALNAGQSSRLGAAAGQGTGSGTAEPVPGYDMLTTDTFESNGTVTDTVDTSRTNAAYSITKKLFTLSCDKTKVVSSNAGTSFILTTSPSFTVAANDIVYMTSGARSGQWRRIASITNQATYTLDSAFTGGNAANPDTCMVAQAVATKDLINFGDATELTRPRDFYAARTVSQVLMDYQDSLTAADDVPDFTQTARLVMSASNSGLYTDTASVPTSDLFTPTVYTRPAAPGQLNDYVLSTNANQQRLFLIWFPNPSNGSVTTAASLLGYDCNFYAQAEAINGGVLDSAYGLSDGSGTPYNMTVSTVSSQTRADLGFTINSTVDPSGVGAQVKVKVNGQDVPKFLSGVTPASQLSYTITNDANGLTRRIVFSQDLSYAPIEIMVFRQFGVYDGSFTQTNKLLGLYDAIVGSAAQVTAGTATHSSLQAAHDAVASGSKILVLNNVTLSGNTTLTKQLLIEGKGIGSVLTGSLTFAVGSAGTIVEKLKVTSTITFNTDNNFMQLCYQTAGQTLTNDVTLYPNNIIQVIGI